MKDLGTFAAELHRLCKQHELSLVACVVQDEQNTMLVSPLPNGLLRDALGDLVEKLGRNPDYAIELGRKL